MEKIFSSAQQLARHLESIRTGRKVVFTNGCFDLIHPGHIKVLKEASALGDILIVGLNDDASVRKLKGSPRPLIESTGRAEILAAMEMVDYVVFFTEETPYKLISEIKPDVLVKGTEYAKEDIVGADIAGRTVTVTMKPGWSTTSLIKKILDE